jgi:TolB-like protein
MANELTATYRSKSPNTKRARLAILDLQASEDLNKQRIGPALTDMITNEFVNKSDFIVLERELFGKIMEEHQLLANFGDVSNAIKVGKVLGAEVVLLGSVTQFKSDLRINLRLVNTETTEILSTTSGMVAISEFSKENPMTSGFVPITQKIGLFAVFEYRFPGKTSTPITTTEGIRVNEVNVSNFHIGYSGLGVRYFPTKNIFIESSFLQVSLDNNTGKSSVISGGTGSKTTEIRGTALRFNVGIKKSIQQKFFYETALGVTFQKLDLDTGLGYIMGPPSFSKTLPYISIGGGINLQQRFVMTLNMRADIGNLNVFEPVTNQEVYTLNPLVLSPQITFYF